LNIHLKRNEKLRIKNEKLMLKPADGGFLLFTSKTLNYGLWGRIEYVGGFLKKAPHAPPKTFEKLV
jgi:hypothetical protein